jgi:hypothetical protein
MELRLLFALRAHWGEGILKIARGDPYDEESTGGDLMITKCDLLISADV